MLIGISHIGIAVRNLDEATRVYVDALETQPGEVHQSPDIGMPWADTWLGRYSAAPQDASLV